jgi:predicted  nucleic acid-binding Zn-ribbon protein
MEAELADLRKMKVEHEQLKQNGQNKATEIDSMKGQISELAAMMFRLAGAKNKDMKSAVSKYLSDGDKARLIREAEEEG